MSSAELNTAAYWERRLASRPNLRGTGHRAFDLRYNRWLYQAQLDCLNTLFQRHSVDVTGRRVLDVGSGIGFYVEHFFNRDAGDVYGIDISETSVNFLQQTFPDATFFVGNIADDSLPLTGPFEIISAISVLYHVVDDGRFTHALDNICSLLSNGGYLVLTDTFRTSLLPTARHAKHRSLETYRAILEQSGLSVIEMVPIYFFLNRTMLPILGPAIINTLDLGRWFYEIDARFRAAGWSNLDGMKMLLARKRVEAGT